MRATAATLMNDRSSRSHSIFVVWMRRQREIPAAAAGGASQRREISARINLVDLAGSERMAKSGAKVRVSVRVRVRVRLGLN